MIELSSTQKIILAIPFGRLQRISSSPFVPLVNGITRCENDITIEFYKPEEEKMKENKTIKAINGYTKFNEGYEKKGGVNTDKKTPRPADPKPQSSQNKN